MMSILKEIEDLSSRVASTLVKNDHFSLFNKTTNTKIVSVGHLRSRKSPHDAERRSLQYAFDTLEGKYKKRNPLTVWKVLKADGSYYYSVRDGNTTLQMLKKQGWDTVPVNVEKEVFEKDLPPIDSHQKA